MFGKTAKVASNVWKSGRRERRAEGGGTFLRLSAALPESPIFLSVSSWPHCLHPPPFRKRNLTGGAFSWRTGRRKGEGMRQRRGGEDAEGEGKVQKGRKGKREKGDGRKKNAREVKENVKSHKMRGTRGRGWKPHLRRGGRRFRRCGILPRRAGFQGFPGFRVLYWVGFQKFFPSSQFALEGGGGVRHNEGGRDPRGRRRCGRTGCPRNNEGLHDTEQFSILTDQF